MEREELNANGAKASGIGNLNVLLGRNGTGKSRFLRKLEEKYSQEANVNVRYISPERAGVFRRDGGIITSIGFQ